MHARLALFAGSALCLLAVAHCTRSFPPPGMADVPVTSSSAELDASGEGGAGGAAPTPERRRPDPALVQKALDRSGMPTPNDQAAYGLRFEVVEMGPDRDWGFAVINRGNDVMRVAFDPRLLSLEVEPPPDPKHKTPPKPHVCRLPSSLRPSHVSHRYVRVLAPGRGLVESFDPRLYCLPEHGESPLVPGAKVTAKLGWPVHTKTVWHHGKREEETPPQTPPFVAVVLPPLPALDQQQAGPTAEPGDAGSAASAPVENAAGPAPEAADAGAIPSEQALRYVQALRVEGTDETAVRELSGTPFELGADYATKSPPPVDGLVLDLTRGSDASTEDTATLTVRLSNHATKSENVFIRRESLTLEVTSVDGTVTCDPGPDDRSPDAQAFTHLAPGRSITLTSRLVELCPEDSFARPGLYLIHGAFDSDQRGARFGLDAFVGHLAAREPAFVRIHAGSLPFRGTRAVERVQVGAVPRP